MAESDESPFNLLIRLSNGQRMEVTLEGEDGKVAEITKILVSQVKDAIAKKDPETPANRQRLVYKGRILDNERTLSDYGIVKGATLFMVKSAAPASSTNPSTGSNAAAASTNAAAGSSAPRPSASTPPSAMPPMMGNPFGMPPMGGGQQVGMPNPEQMQAMMNSPQMQGLMDNPDLLGRILESSMQSPQMQQLMDQNPELRQLYSDPAMIQQAIQMMRNPQHMQQVMRQQDLAMSQLENMPGGFAALSNMYRNVQEPMMEAQQASRQPNEPNAASRNSGGTEGATGAAMPNPWGSPAPAPSANNSARNSAPAMANPFAMAGTNPWGSAQAGGAGGMPNPWGAPPNPWAATGSGNAGNGMPNMGAFPGMPPGGAANMDQMMQMLNDPTFSQMMSNMVESNPDMIRTMIEAQNPMMRQMFQGNPEAANDFIRNMFNPQNMRAMMELQRSMGGGGMPNFGAMGGMPGFGMPAGGAGGEMDFSNLLQQFQQTGLGAGAQAPPANPADRYRNQLRQLEGMGFDNEQANLAALTAAHGNLNRAVDQLLSSPSSPPAPSPSPASAADSSTIESNTGTPNNDQSASPPAEDSTPKNETEKKND